jgi:hypothetical protein
MSIPRCLLVYHATVFIPLPPLMLPYALRQEAGVHNQSVYRGVFGGRFREPLRFHFLLHGCVCLFFFHARVSARISLTGKEEAEEKENDEDASRGGEVQRPPPQFLFISFPYLWALCIYAMFLERFTLRLSILVTTLCNQSKSSILHTVISCPSPPSLPHPPRSPFAVRHHARPRLSQNSFSPFPPAVTLPNPHSVIATLPALPAPPTRYPVGSPYVSPSPNAIRPRRSPMPTYNSAARIAARDVQVQHHACAMRLSLTYIHTYMSTLVRSLARFAFCDCGVEGSGRVLPSLPQRGLHLEQRGRNCITAMRCAALRCGVLRAGSRMWVAGLGAGLEALRLACVGLRASRWVVVVVVVVVFGMAFRRPSVDLGGQSMRDVLGGVS